MKRRGHEKEKEREEKTERDGFVVQEEDSACFKGRKTASGKVYYS